jgi:hypothetical protein
MSNLKRKIGIIEALIIFKGFNLFSLKSKKETKEREKEIKILTSAEKIKTKEREHYLYHNKNRI